MNNLFLLLFTIFIILTIFKISFDNITNHNTSYSLAFCTFFIVFYMLAHLFDFLSIPANPIYPSILIGIIFLIASIIYSKKIDLYNLKHVIFPISLGIIVLIYSTKYAPYVSLTGEMDIIKYLEYFTNNKLPFYQLFYSLFDIFNLNSQIFSIPLFINTLIFIFFFLLSDSLYIYSENKTINVVSLLTYFLFFISYACLKFPYIYYMWIIFPINIIFTFIDNENINISESIILSLSYFSIFTFLNDIQLSIIIMSIILIINELSGSINDNNYKFLLILLFVPILILDFDKNIPVVIFLIIITATVLIKLIQIDTFAYVLITILLLFSLLYNHNFEMLSVYALTDSYPVIDFFNFDTNKIYIIAIYIILFIICLINFKKHKEFNKQVILSLLITFNPYILSILSKLFNYSYILIFILFNPKTISLLFSYVSEYLKTYNLDKNFIIASSILAAFCTSSIFYPNIYDRFKYEENKLHRMSEDEFNIYKFIFEENIDVSGNIISHAPNTAAYFNGINLLNDYHYYTQLSDETLIKAPDNLTNIFAIRQYAEQEYFNQERNYDDSFKQLKEDNFKYIIFRKDQSIYYKDFYAPLFHLYLDIYEVIYENDTFALLALK